MSNQMPDNNRTMRLSSEGSLGSPNAPKSGRNPLILGGAIGCVVVVLLLACGATAAWYFTAGPGKASTVPTAIALASSVPATPRVATPLATKPAASQVPHATATVAAAKTNAAPTTAVAATAEEPTAVGTTANATTAAPQGPLLVFTSNRGGNYDIYVAPMSQPDSVTDLTKDNPGVDSDPAWSPDGKQIAFSSDRSGALEIYVMNADGSSVTQLTHDNSLDSLPSWSPDGTKIAYSAHLTSTNSLDLIVMKADGTSPVQFTAATADDYGARWSPDGKQLVFLTTRDFESLKGTAEIYIKPSNTSGSPKRVMPNIENAQSVEWAPDGTHLVFAGKPDPKGTFQIFAVQPDGTSLSPLGTAAANETFPTYSPDGTQILFASDAGGNSNLWVMKADGSGQKQLTNDKSDNVEPALQPMP